VPLRWPAGEIRYSGPTLEPADAEESLLPPIVPTVPLESSLPPSSLPEIAPPPTRPALAPDQVRVKVLEQREIAGKVQFFVQEEGKPRGVLAYGVPPPVDKLPQVGDEITVYRNNQDARSPPYRWDRRVPPGAPSGRRRLRRGERR
jgi:hypothetical protein